MSDRFPHIRHPTTTGRTHLYLVRHGRTASNVGGLLHGWTDVPLDEHGHAQARRIADRFLELPPVDALVSSPLNRALTTATFIGDRIGLAPRIAPDLMEINFGQIEGVSVARLVEEHPEIAARLDDLEDHEAGWPGGDTRRGFHERAYAAFLAIMAEYHDHRVAVVAHGGVIGSFLATIHGVNPNDWARFHVHNCSLTHLEVVQEGTSIHLENDICHLEDLDDAIDPMTSALERSR